MALSDFGTKGPKRAHRSQLRNFKWKVYFFILILDSAGNFESKYVSGPNKNLKPLLQGPKRDFVRLFMQKNIFQVVAIIFNVILLLWGTSDKNIRFLDLKALKVHKARF